MGVNSLITWAVIDLVMKAVITETQSFGPRVFAIEVMLEKREFQILCQASRETRALDSASWYCSNAEMRLSCSRLGHCSNVEMRVSTLASWCCAGGDD